MGLPRAIKAHKNNDFKTARVHYQRAIDQGDHKYYLFQNYGALLRELGNFDEAKEIYRKGLEIFPDNEGILSNYANILKDDTPWLAFDIHLRLFSVTLANPEKPVNENHFLALINHLISSNCCQWAYELCILSFKILGPKPSILVAFFKAATNPSNPIISGSAVDQLIAQIDKCIDDIDDLDRAEYYFALSWIHSERSSIDRAYEFFEHARAILSRVDLINPENVKRANKLNNANSWNMSCMLLSHQNFSDGWKLYDFGLQTEAKGPQKWQRALPKPFSQQQIPLWKGESLANKRILLLEEQAVGDVMQFMTLINYIIDESSQVGILLSNRLFPIYERSLNAGILSEQVSLYCFDDVKDNKIPYSGFDYQAPLGSMCQFRFTDIHKYGSCQKFLQAPVGGVNLLRDRYSSLGSVAKKIVGISWRGGGRGDRILQKSIEVDKFANLITGFPDIRFVSLQYGESESVISKFKDLGIDAHHDSSINPLKNMDGWLAQVGACDAVVSVANTTIHGAGGLGIPTYCLLSLHSDWRWLKDPTVVRSYWYPSVGIARQSPDSQWSTAFSTVRQWLLEGCPMPVGKYHI